MAIVVNDPKNLLSPNQTNLLISSASMPFNLGGFASLEDILARLGVEVNIMPGVFKHNPSLYLNDALRCWGEIFRMLLELIQKANDESERDTLLRELENAGEIIESLGCDINGWPEMLLRGLYDPVRRIIELYPEEMMQEYEGTCMDELLVSTLAHETMHAYFDRDGRNVFPYVPTVEEPLAEFGMLLYLNETGSSYYDWAYQDVKDKRTCYWYGAYLMDQLLAESSPYPTRRFLEAFKIRVPDYSVLKVDGGEVTILSPKKGGFGVGRKRVGGKTSRRTPTKKGSGVGLPSFPIAPPPLPTPATVPPKGKIVVKQKAFSKFAFEVFGYLEKNGLINQLGVYICSLTQISHVKSICKDSFFKLRGVLYDKKDHTTIPSGYYKKPITILADEYYFSNSRWSEKTSNVHNHLDDLAQMIKYVYPGRFDIRKDVDIFVLIEY